jgi:hypothetical protein
LMRKTPVTSAGINGVAIYTGLGAGLSHTAHCPSPSVDKSRSPPLLPTPKMLRCFKPGTNDHEAGSSSRQHLRQSPPPRAPRVGRNLPPPPSARDFVCPQAVVEATEVRQR